MGRLIKIQDIDQFFDVVNVPYAAVNPVVLGSVRQLDERRELEPMLREILWDPTETPHGPTEIGDILTTKVRVRGERQLAAFVVKGKSSAKVRSGSRLPIWPKGRSLALRSHFRWWNRRWCW